MNVIMFINHVHMCESYLSTPIDTVVRIMTLSTTESMETRPTSAVIWCHMVSSASGHFFFWLSLETTE